MKKKNIVFTLLCGIFAASVHAAVDWDCHECDPSITNPNDPRSCHYCDSE